MLCLEAVFQPPDTLRPQRGQSLAVLIEVDQREAGAQPVVVLLQAPVSHFVEAEDALPYPERMLHLSSLAGLGRVLAPGLFIHIVLEPGAAAGHILRVRRCLADAISLPLIPGIAPYLAFLAMK